MSSIAAVAELRREQADEDPAQMDEIIDAAEQVSRGLLQEVVDHVREHNCGGPDYDPMAS